MNRIPALLCTLVLAVTVVTGQKSPCCNASDPQNWSRYTIKDEQFSVMLPSMPSMMTVKEKERLGRHLRTRLDGVQYGIDVFENTKGQSLEDFIAEYNTNSGTDLTTGRDIVVNDVPGKEYFAPDSPPATVQFFVMERRLLRFVAVGGDKDNAAVKQFFSSIVLGKGVGIKVSDGPGMPLELDTGERIYSGKEVDQRARLISKPPPSYPEEARAAGDGSTTVVLQAIFSKTGNVVDIKVLTPGRHGLTEACIAATEKITFVPAMKDGKPVSTYMRLEYYFGSI